MRAEPASPTDLAPLLLVYDNQMRNLTIDVSWKESLCITRRVHPSMTIRAINRTILTHFKRPLSEVPWILYRGALCDDNATVQDYNCFGDDDAYHPRCVLQTAWEGKL